MPDQSRALRDRIQDECICATEWKDAEGTFDAVTNEWLPNARAKHVRLIVNPACPIHRPCATCASEAEEIRVVGRDHRNVSNAGECPDCGRPWDDGEIAKINQESAARVAASSPPSKAPLPRPGT